AAGAGARRRRCRLGRGLAAEPPHTPLAGALAGALAPLLAPRLPALLAREPTARRPRRTPRRAGPGRRDAPRHEQAEQDRSDETPQNVGPGALMICWAGSRISGLRGVWV